jgi:uncharacterized protein
MTFRDCFILKDETTVFFAKVKVATGVVGRARGLLFKPPLDSGYGMYFFRCNSIHTWFMRYPIDVVYLDEENCIVKIVSCLKPWRFSGSLRASSVIEVPAGYAKEKLLEIGDKVYFDSV